MPRFGSHEIADMTFYNLSNGKPELFLNTLKMSNMENNADSSYAQGGSGAPRLVGWDFNRTVQMTIQNALLYPKAISMQLGTDLVKKVETVFKREVIVAVADTTGNAKVTLSKAPKAGSLYLVKSVDGISHDSEIEQASVVITGMDASAPTTAMNVGEQVIAYYQYDTTATAEVITVNSDKFAGYYRAVGDTLWRNEASGQDEKVQIILPKVKVASQFTLTMQPDGDPSVFDFNLDVFKPQSSTEMVKIVRY